jgi:hypothetical protein
MHSVMLRRTHARCDVTQRTLSRHRQPSAAMAPHSMIIVERMVVHAIAWKPLHAGVVETRHAALSDHLGMVG